MDLTNVIALTTVLLGHVATLIAEEQKKLLSIVRTMPVQPVMSNGQKAFVVDSRTRIDKARVAKIVKP